MGDEKAHRILFLFLLLFRGAEEKCLAISLLKNTGEELPVQKQLEVKK